MVFLETLQHLTFLMVEALEVFGAVQCTTMMLWENLVSAI